MTMSRHLEIYNHNDRIGVLLLLETTDDVTIKTREFRTLAKDLAVQIVACDPASSADGHDVFHFLRHSLVRDEGKKVIEYIKEVEVVLKARIRVIKYVRYSSEET